jgi:hypothetical protein
VSWIGQGWIYNCSGNIIFYKDTFVSCINCTGNVVANESLNFCGGEIEGDLEISDFLTCIDVEYLKVAGGIKVYKNIFESTRLIAR